MKILIEAAVLRQALEALEFQKTCFSSCADCNRKGEKAITTLRTALEEVKAEKQAELLRHNNIMYFSGNQPDSGALKLAKECGVLHISEPTSLEAFYRAAFNAGLEAAAMRVESDMHNYAPCIRTLKVEV